MSSTHSCRVWSSSRAILSSLISACKLSTVGSSSLWFTVLLSTNTLGGSGRPGGGVLGGSSDFEGYGRRFSVPCNNLGAFTLYLITVITILFKRIVVLFESTISYCSDIQISELLWSSLELHLDIQLDGWITLSNRMASVCTQNFHSQM